MKILKSMMLMAAGAGAVVAYQRYGDYVMEMMEEKMHYIKDEMENMK